VTLYAGKLVVVTGTSRGLGKLIAEHFLSEGANVIGLSRSPSDIRNARYVHQSVDVTDAMQVRQALAGLSKLDILVNNAGVGPVGFAIIMDPDKARDAILTNVYGTFLVSREAIRVMGRVGGRIVNIGSILASLEPVGASIYAATKAAIDTLSGVMAKEVASKGITVNTIGMASIETEMFTALGAKGQEYVAALPLPRMTVPDDVYNLIDFFCSPRSSFVTGQTIYLGGVR
jgi:3-oxoacyl-[acyl-carrier protein] reductase